jgi:hypothetical protein
MADGKSDIKLAGPECFNWDQANPVESLKALRTFVEEEAKKATDWYWAEKNKKKGPSQKIQFMALVLTALAGLTPIVIQIIRGWDPNNLKMFDSGPIASLLVGLAAALLGLDKAFGYSSGWIRYVVTATSMTRVLQEFRMDWATLYSASSQNPTLEQQAALIQRAKTFIVDIQAMLLQETKDWAAEFQSNAAQMERDVKTQLDSLKSQVERISKERLEAARPGAIELTVANADKTDGFRFDVLLEGKTGAFTGTATSTKTWAKVDVPPGQYRLKIDAKAKGAGVAQEAVIEVKPGEKKDVALALPIAA